MDKQNVVCTHNEILFSHQKEGILIHATKWMNLDNMTVSEISQSQKDPPICMGPLQSVRGIEPAFFKSLLVYMCDSTYMSCLEQADS